MSKVVIEFPTQFKRTNARVYSNPGSRFVNEYGLKYEEDGSSHLVVTGQTDFHAQIQADADSCDINIIVKRFTEGDVDALNRVKGLYFDSTDMPSTYAELLQRINDCNEMFDALPIEIKEKFNNSADEFWSSYGTDEWNDIIFNRGAVDDPIVDDPIVEKEVE